MSASPEPAGPVAGAKVKDHGANVSDHTFACWNEADDWDEPETGAT